MSAWLIDTHALLWFLTSDERLTGAAEALMIDAGSTMYVSSASLWEIAIKASQGRLDVPDGLPGAITEQGFESLDVTFEHSWRVRQLPLAEHRDPFDRLLVAQALTERLGIISNDAQMDQYGIVRHW